MFRAKRKFFALRIYRSVGRISRGRGGMAGAGASGGGCCRRLRGSTLTLNFSMGLRPRLSAVAASAAYWNPRAGAPGDHPPSNCRPCVVSCFQAQRSWVGWRFGEGCCRRLRGSTFELPLFHGLTPTAKCGRRIRGLLEPPGWRFGEWCCRRHNGHTNSSDVYRRPVESITVLFMSVLSKLCCGWTCYQHPLQSTTIPHIMGGWML